MDSCRYGIDCRHAEALLSCYVAPKNGRSYEIPDAHHLNRALDHVRKYIHYCPKTPKQCVMMKEHHHQLFRHMCKRLYCRKMNDREHVTNCYHLCIDGEECTDESAEHLALYIHVEIPDHFVQQQRAKSRRQLRQSQLEEIRTEFLRNQDNEESPLTPQSPITPARGYRRRMTRLEYNEQKYVSIEEPLTPVSPPLTPLVSDYEDAKSDTSDIRRGEPMNMCNWCKETVSALSILSCGCEFCKDCMTQIRNGMCPDCEEDISGWKDYIVTDDSRYYVPDRQVPTPSERSYDSRRSIDTRRSPDSQWVNERYQEEVKVPDEPEEDICAICRDEPTEPRALAGCLHKFCHLCILQALEHKNACPLCRQDNDTDLIPVVPSSNRNWECAQCTYLNDGNHMHCEMCGSSNVY